MQFGLLGTVEASDDVGVPCPVPQGRLRNLLATLLVRSNTTVPIDALAACVWEEAQLPRRPREALQVMVVRLRKHLGPQVGARISSARPGYRLTVQPGEVDLHRFEELLRKGSAALAALDWCAGRDLLGDALSLWRGDPLADIRPGTALDRNIDALAGLRLRARRQLIEARLRLGGHAELVAEVAALIEDHPFDEQLLAQHMLALHGCGRRAEALEAFQRVRRTLADELGIEPGAELRELHQALLVDSAEPRQWTAGAPAPTAGDSHRVQPAQLPAGLADFTARTLVAAQLEAQLTKATGSWARGPVVLSAIDGAGGIGKTSLAVHVGHQVAGHFPDGQLYADLHGTGGSPATPGEVLARFLRGLGIPSENVPADLEERGALFRTTLAARRVLVLLDNVRDAAQVRPLLPGSSSCAVLITSRSNLPGLDGASRLTLDFLDEGDALELFTRIVGRELVAAELTATRTVLKICAGLPLAIRIAASRISAEQFGADPRQSIPELARRMADERLRLGELMLEDRAVRASFAVSYNDLPTDRARAFRLLGLFEGSSIGVSAAAALFALPTAATEQVLESLTRMHLLQSTEPGRYRFHDLLRLFAAECAQTAETPEERDAAVHRLLDWYLRGSAAASRQLNPTRRHLELDPAVVELEAPDFSDYDEALAWCETERTNLVAAVAQAARTGRHEIGWKLPITMWDLFYRSPWHEERIGCYESALVSAQTLGDREATAWVLNSLASAYQAAGRLTEARESLTRAREIRSDLGDVHGEGSCLINLGYVYVEMDQPVEAIKVLQRALEIFRTLAVRAGEGAAHTNLGEAHARLGDFTTALEHHQESLDIHGELSNQFAVGRDLTNVAGSLLHLGRLDEAADHAARGHETSRLTGNQVDEGVALDILGRIHDAQGHRALARQHWEDAYAVLDALGHPRAADIKARLAGQATPAARSGRDFTAAAPDAAPASG